MEIVKVIGREILDSRGNPTVEADVLLADGTVGPRRRSFRRIHRRARSGRAARQRSQALPGQRVRARPSQNIIKKIAPAVTGMEAEDQSAIDRKMIELDGTPNKGKLGANAILAVSMAAARAAAQSQMTPLYRYLGGVGANLLPVPQMNILNGGAHADNSVDPQEFMIVPYGASKFSEALRMGAEVFHTLKGVLKKRGYSTSVGDEGGFAPNLKSNEEALEVVLEAITKAGYKPGDADRHRARSGGQRVLRHRQAASTSSRNPTRASAPPSRW